MAASKLKDYSFILSLCFLCIVGGFFIYQEIEKRSVLFYLEAVQETVAEMIPEQQERDKFNQAFASFLERVEEEGLERSEIDSLSKKVLGLRFKKDSIAFAEAASVIPAEKPGEPDKPAGLSRLIVEVPKGDWDNERTSFLASVSLNDSLRKVENQFAKVLNKLETQVSLREQSHESVIKELQQSAERVTRLELQLSKLKGGNREAWQEVERKLAIELQKLKERSINVQKEIVDIKRLEKEIEKQKAAIKVEASPDAP